MRKDLNEYFMDIAIMTSKRSTCTRAIVGAILVKDSRIIATGFNGSPSGFKHCTDEVCITKDGHCINTVHAEINCIIQAAKLGVSVIDSILYCTHKPCHNCCKILINAGIKKVYYRNDYDDGYNKLYNDYIEMIKI